MSTKPTWHGCLEDDVREMGAVAIVIAGGDNRPKLSMSGLHLLMCSRGLLEGLPRDICSFSVSFLDLCYAGISTCVPSRCIRYTIVAEQT